MNRVLGRYSGTMPGALLLVTAAMHGNEHAGVKALELVFKMLEVEPITNPSFQFNGTILGIIGNLKAYEKGVRYVKKDINRLWIPDYIKRIIQAPLNFLEDEDAEIKQILEIIQNELQSGMYDRLILFDLHTTSSEGGIFSIATEDEDSIRIAEKLHAPVVRGLMSGIQGTTLHYFNSENFNILTSALAFEAGYHHDPKSINRTIAAVINCLRSIGAVHEKDVENIHDQLLFDYSENLPKMVRVIDKYTVKDNLHWQMLPGYRHFQSVKKGEKLAIDNNEIVTASSDGMLLMPLYQSQGNDGFFIVESC